MNATGRRCQVLVTAAVVAVFAAFWVLVFAMSEPPEFPSQYFFSAIVIAVVATPWVIAARILWRDFWARAAKHLPSPDGAAVLLHAAVTALPDDHSDWGAAMSAELTQVHGGAARWHFAVGCARAALFPPRSSRIPVIVVGALSVTLIAIVGYAVGAVLPAMQFFAVTLAALVGALATTEVARSRVARRNLPGPTITGSGVVGVAACIALTAYFLIEHPTAADHFPRAGAAVFAIVLSGCLWLALTPPRWLSTSRLARGVAVGAAAVLGLGFLATSRLTINTLAGPVIWVLFAPAVVFLAASALSTVLGRSFHAGVQTAVWTALVGTLLIFAISIPETMYRYAIDGRTLADGESGYPIGVNLPSAIWVLVAIPLLGLPFGVIGAAVGRRLRRA